MLNFLLIASFQACFIALLILFKRKKNRADHVLFTIFLVYAITIGLSYAEIYNRTHGYPYPLLMSVSVPFLFLHAPLLWFYVMRLTKHTFRFKPVHALHLIPFMLSWLVFWQISYRLPQSERIIMDAQATFQQELSYPVFLMTIALSTLIYYTLALFRLRCYRKQLREFLSETGPAELKWLRLFLWLALVSHMSISLLYIADFWLKLMDYNTLQLAGFIVASIYTLSLGFFGFRQGDVFVSERKAAAVSQSKMENDEPLPDEDEMFIHTLLNLMKTTQIFRQQELTLAELADACQVTPEYLSGILNNRLKSSFFDFVNRYRVEAFQSDCLKPENKSFTLLAIAYDCGFNSKATFNRVFKQVTGITPGAYVNTKIHNAE